MKNRKFLTAALLLCLAAIPAQGYSFGNNIKTPVEVNRGHLPKILYRAVKLADSKMSEQPPESYEWEWTGGVMMVGIIKLYEATGELRYLDYVKKWLDYHIEQGYTLSKSDQLIPGLLLLRVYKATGDKKYLDNALKIGEYITDKALRTDEGGLIHFGPMGGKSMWIDSLFMFGPLLIELSQVTGDRKFLDEAVKQSLIMYSHLQDSNGLCRHYFDAATGKTNNAHWLRGNSWALAATAILLSSLPDDYNPELRQKLFDHFKKHIDGVVKRQAADGMWHTVIDEPKTYIESSGTALVAFSIIKGVKSGLLSEDYLPAARRALFGLMKYVTIHPDGFCTISDVSMGTGPGDVGYYNQIELAENVPYGVGAYLMAATAYMESMGYKYNAEAMAVEDGWEALRWGRVYEAKEASKKALEMSPQAPDANFLAGFTNLAALLVDLVQTFTDMSVGARGMTPARFEKLLSEKFAPGFAEVGQSLAKAETDPAFTVVIERATFLGGTSFGYMQMDLSEVYFIHAVARFAEAGLYFLGSYNLDGPPLLVAKRKFGEIVRDPAYPEFLTLNDRSAELLPKSRAALSQAFGIVKSMVAFLKSRSVVYPGGMMSLDLLRMKGWFYIPGVLEPQPVTKLVSKSRLAGVVMRHFAKDVPEKLPGWMDDANDSLMNGRTLNITKKIKLNLAAWYDNPVNLRELYPTRTPDGEAVFPDPTLGGLLPGMTNEQLRKVAGPPKK